MNIHPLLKVITLLLLLSACNQQAARSLYIYWVDVEGGAATLIVTPDGESVLMDAGWRTDDDRDAIRIMAAMEDAGIQKIDYFIASHFHSDHVGGLPALAKRVPIGLSIDHGESVEQDRPGGLEAWKNYQEGVKGLKRHAVLPGETLTIRGINFTFVTANRSILDRGLSNIGPNALCDSLSTTEQMGENPSSVGYLLNMGEFDFLNLGDLTIDLQEQLACPSNLIGVIDLYQIPHHGNGISAELTQSLDPTTVVLNNGPHKGGSPEGFEVISAVPGIKTIWQVHSALDSDDDHNTSAQLTANLTEQEDAGYWIKAIIQPDGKSYQIENGRNSYHESYQTK